MKYTSKAALFAAVIMTGSASAATISFSTYIATGAADTSWVITSSGVESVNFGGGDTTYGGVTWYGTSINGGQTYRNVSTYTLYHSAPGIAWANVAANTFYPSDSSVSLLHNGTWINGQATQDIGINGLTIGNMYEAKFVFADSRPAFDNSTISLANLGFSSSSATVDVGYPDGRYVVVTARWTADAANQAFVPTWNGFSNQSFLNGLQVVTIPESSTLLLGLFSVAAFIRRKR